MFVYLQWVVYMDACNDLQVYEQDLNDVNQILWPNAIRRQNEADRA